MGFIRTRGERQQAIFFDAEGRQRSAGTFPTKREAREAIKRAEVAASSGDWTPPRAGRVTFRAYVEDTFMPGRMVRPTTLAGNRSFLNAHLLPAFGDTQLVRITPATVQRWVAQSHAAGTTPVTLHRVHTLLSTILKRAVIDQHVSSNPCLYTQLPVVQKKPVQVITPAQSDAILAAIPARHRCMVMTLVETGMRWGEVQALRVDDLDVEGELVHVRASVAEVPASITGERYIFGPTKANRLRQVCVDSACVDAIMAHVEARGLSGRDLLFGVTPARPMSRNNFRTQVWLPALDRARVGQKVRVHDLRHTHASWLLAGGADILVVMERLGHSQLATTQGYLHTLPGADGSAIEALARVRQAAAANSPSNANRSS
jgi:integrase